VREEEARQVKKPFTPVEVFCSFADEDAPLQEQLEHHLSLLRREGQITTWHKRQITAGSNWQVELDQHLQTASLILLLISPDFFASDYHYGVELQRVMERYDAHEVQVIPILLRPCNWKDAPFEKLQVVPRNKIPLTQWSNLDAGLTEVVQEIRLALQNLPSMPFSMPTLKRPLWNVPYGRNPYFTGRDELFDHLDQYLTPTEQTASVENRRVALTQPHAIKGLGGIGKTQIAIEYAYRSRELGRYMHIFWVNAASVETIIASFVTIADQLPSLAAHDETDQHKLVEEIKRWLEQCKERWLLIFDNADEIALIRDYLPKGGNGSILLTTRANAVGGLATSIEVETLGFLEGTHLLLRRAQRFEHASDEEINQAGNIVVALDHFPLALDQAGAYIEQTQCNFTTYLQIYQNHRKELLAVRGIQTTDYPDSVATTWSLSFQKVEQANPAAAELLRLCAFLAPDSIPEELIRDGASHWTPLLQQAAAALFPFNQMIAELLKFSLIKRLPETQSLSIHRLVQAVQMDTIELEVQQQWAKRVVCAVDQIFPLHAHDAINWPQCLRYLEQAQTCDALIRQHKLVLPEAANLLHRTGTYLTRHALYTRAEPLYQQALHIFEQQGRPDHAGRVTILASLAELHYLQGRYTEAEALYQQALHISEQVFGLEHPIGDLVFAGLAMLYKEQGRYAEAEAHHQRALRTSEQIFGPEDPAVITAINNLAIAYKAQGKYAEAESLYQRALRISEQTLGPEHPFVAMVLHNLANLYYSQGRSRNEKVEQLYQRALTIREQALGPEHPEVAQTLSSLADLYYDQSRYAEAESLYQQALHIGEQALGSEHPFVAMILHNLANLYREQKRYAEAEPLYQRALAIQEQIPDSKHLDLARTLTDLAHCYETQGRDANAEQLYQRALLIQEQALGSQHLELVRTLNNLADLYWKQSKHTEAEALYQQALHIREQTLGPEHLQVAYALNNLVGLYQEQRKYAEAEQFCQRGLAIFEQELGSEHPDVAQTLTVLADLSYHQGKYAEAGKLNERALSIREQTLGNEHPIIAQTLMNLAIIYAKQKRYAEAEALQWRALRIFEQVQGPETSHVAQALQNLVILHYVQGKYAEAEKLNERVWRIRVRMSGTNGLENLATRTEWMDFLRKMGQ